MQTINQAQRQDLWTLDQFCKAVHVPPVECLTLDDVRDCFDLGAIESNLTH